MIMLFVTISCLSNPQIHVYVMSEYFVLISSLCMLAYLHQHICCLSAFSVHQHTLLLIEQLLHCMYLPTTFLFCPGAMHCWANWGPCAWTTNNGVLWQGEPTYGCADRRVGQGQEPHSHLYDWQGKNPQVMWLYKTEQLDTDNPVASF